MSTETVTLYEYVTAILTANGFTKYDPQRESARNPSFVVAAGVGATVSLSWEAPPSERALMLAKYENRLRAGGLTVENRERYLYVSQQPSHLWPCGCLINDTGAHRVGCPDHPEGVRG